MPPLELSNLNDWIVVGCLGGLLLLGLFGLLRWYVRSERAGTAPAPPPIPSLPTIQTPGPAKIPESPETLHGPSYRDLTPDAQTMQEGLSLQVQTSSHNLRIERAGGQNRYVVNGVAYNRLEDIPEADIRQQAQGMLQKTNNLSDLRNWGTNSLRQLVIGNQVTVEIRSPNYNVSVQRQGRETRFIVNGKTYYSLNEIADMALRARAKDLMDRFLK